MKILQVIDFMPQTSGGARFVVNLAKALKLKGCDVDVLLIDGKPSHFTSELLEAGIKIISLNENINRFNLKYSFQISKYLEKYDVVHVHIFPSSYQVAIASFFTSNSAPIVFTEHNSFNRRASNPVFKYIEKFVYSRFDHIVCLSQQVLSFVDSKLKINHSKLSIIENAVDVEAINLAPVFNKVDLDYKESDFLLLMSARFTSQKNHEVIIESLRKLPEEIKLIFAGDGVLMNKMKELVELYNLNNRVSFLGSRSDVLSLMKTVDVNVLASNFEGLSLAALEAMSTGKPFIGSNVDGIDFVINNKDYLFNNNANELADLILKLYKDQLFYQKAANDTYERSKNFDIHVMTDKYLEVYKKLIS